MRDNAVDILVIGAQRAMTSWLHTVLCQHPGIAPFPDNQPVTSGNKEAHYWDWNHHRGSDWYRVLMRPLRDHDLSVDVTPEYAFLSPSQVAECKALNPTARVIYVLRDPLARAVSAIRMQATWASGGAAADSYPIRFDTQCHRFCRDAHLAEHGNYAGNIARWRAVYPDLLILSVEAIQNNPEAALRRIFTHVGLDLDALSDTERARIADRARQIIWQTEPYPLDQDCLYFLDGLTRPHRDAVAQALDLHFDEGARLMESAP